MKPFFTRLRDYWEAVGEALRGESSVASVFPNSTDIGGSRERLYVEFLRAHVPAFCTVNLGGFVFGEDGSDSKQIDVLVASGSSLRFDFNNRDGNGKSFSSVDGLVAAVSLKSTLDGKEILEGVQNLASIPAVQPLVGRYHPMGPPIANYESWPLKVLYAPDGVKLETALTHLDTAVANIPATRWPDIVHVCGQYVIVKIDSDGKFKRSDGTPLLANTFFAQSVRPDAWAFMQVVLRE
jgi:hypothetical protein